jgi:hypothetical protein
VLRKEHANRTDEAADAHTERLAAAKKVADAVAERDLARQMLKGVQAMLGHAEAAKSTAQKALQQAQAEKAASQVPPPSPTHPPHTHTRSSLLTTQVTWLAGNYQSQEGFDGSACTKVYGTVLCGLSLAAWQSLRV